jgi:hypothetical protein
MFRQPRNMAVDYFVATQAVIASEAKQSPSCKEEIASSQKTLLAMTRAEHFTIFTGRYCVERIPKVFS